MKPVVNRLSEEYQGQVDFLAVDVTQESSKPLMDKYRFVGRPQFVVVLPDGTIVASRNGIQPYERLKADIETALAK
jgi:thioredoxin-like negative regulator of GroEL